MNKIDIFNNEDFQALPAEKKTNVVKNYFNKNLADDDFNTLDEEKKNSIIGNFVKAQINPIKEDVQKKHQESNDKKNGEFGDEFTKALNNPEILNREIKIQKDDNAYKKIDEEDKPIKALATPGDEFIDEAVDDLVGNETEKEEKSTEILSNIQNIQFANSDLTDMIKGFAGDEESLKNIQDKAMQTNKAVADTLYAIGIHAVIDEDGEVKFKDDDGTIKVVGDSFWEGLKEDIENNKLEIAGDIIGGATGATLTKKYLDKVKAGAKIGGWKGKVAQGLGTLLGAAVGAFGGRAADVENSKNELLSMVDNLQKATNLKDVIEENPTLQKALDGANMTIYGTAIADTAIKGIKGTGKVIGETVKENIVDPAKKFVSRVDGAKDILKKDLKIDDEFIDNSLENAKKEYKEVEDYSKDSKEQEALLAATLEKGDANIIEGAIYKSETAARNLADTIDSRADTITSKLNETTASGTEVQNYLKSFEKETKKNFGKMRENFTEAFKETDFKFELSDLNLDTVFRDMSKRVQDPDVAKKFISLQKSIKNTIYNSNAQIGIERDIDGILDLRQQLNKFYGKNEQHLTNKKDKEIFSALKENIDNQIYKATDKYLPEDLANSLISDFDKSMSRYRELGELSNNPVFNSIMTDAKDSKYRIDQLVKHMADDDSYVDDVLSKMKPEEREVVESAVIRDITASFTGKTKEGKKAIAFEDLGEKLSSIKHNVRSQLGKELIDNLELYANKFGNKDILYLDMARGVTTKPVNNISTSLSGKIEMQVSSWRFDLLQQLMPTDNGKRLALQKHIRSALEKSRTPQELTTRIYKYPDLSDNSKYLLKKAIQTNNKLLSTQKQEKQLQIIEEAKKEQEEFLKQKQTIKTELENFSTPSIEEIRAVETHTKDDKYGSFSQMTVKIKAGTATPEEIEKYIKAKNEIDPEKLEQTILKNKYPINDESRTKLEKLKSLDTEVVEEILPEQHFKALLHDIKNGKIRNDRYQDAYYELNKLYEKVEPKIELKNQETILPNDLKEQGFKELEDGTVLDPDGKVLFAKGLDNLAAGTYAGIEEDEDGNISFNPGNFVAGLGGFTAAKYMGAKIIQNYKLDEKLEKKIVDFILDAENEMAKVAGGGKPPKNFIDEQGFYSVLEKTVDEKVGGKIDSVSLAKMLEKNGVKNDELEWSGLKELMDSKDKVTKEEIENTIKDNRLVIEKVESEETDISEFVNMFDEEDRKLVTKMINEKDDNLTNGNYEKEWDYLHEKYNEKLDLNEIHDLSIDIKDKTEYSKYKLDFGQNYRELLFRSDLQGSGLKETQTRIEEILKRQEELKKISNGKEIPDEFKEEWKSIWKEKEDLINKKKELEGYGDNQYHSGHWEESNILVFTRVDDRVIDDKKTLFVEELQSDWHQAGRKSGYAKDADISEVKKFFGFEDKQWNEFSKDTQDGYIEEMKEHHAYKGNGVPDAPFKKNWSELGIKRLIQEAVEKDYDKLAWTTGKQQAKRYSLEKKVDLIVYNKANGTIQGTYQGDDVFFKSVASDEEIAAIMGKDLTKKLIDPKSSTRENLYVLQGDELEFGGDGMKAFYDKIVPNTVKKLFKKYKVKPKMEELDDIEEMVWSIDITEKMKEDISKYGQPLYVTAGVGIGLEATKDGENNE